MPVKKSFHPLHVSTTDLSYNAQDGKLEATCTIFVDDFELALQKEFNTKMDLQKPALHEAMDAFVKKYFASHLQVKAGDKSVQLTYLGFEINKEATNIYLESEKIPAPKKVEVDVSLLHNIFNDQLNIVHITVAGVRKSGRVDFPERKIIQSF